MKNAVIIGATGGIGGELARLLKADGYHIIPVSRSVGITCDLADFAQINNAIKQIKNQVKCLDLLVYAAGASTYKNLIDVSDTEIQEAFMVNVIAPAIFVRELVPLMNRKNFLVLNIGSGAGTIPTRGRSVYCATKFALRGLSLSLSEEYDGKNPKFCHISLGSTLTNFGPKSLEEKKREFEQGRAYFPVDWVVNKLMEIIKDEHRANEITLFPEIMASEVGRSRENYRSQD